MKRCAYCRHPVTPYGGAVTIGDRLYHMDCLFAAKAALDAKRD